MGADQEGLKEVGLLFYIMVDNIDVAIQGVIAHGGKIMQPVGMDCPGDHRAIHRSGGKHYWSIPGTTFLALTLTNASHNFLAKGKNGSRFVVAFPQSETK